MGRGVIVDLDGTVYQGDELLPGAETGIEQLRAESESLLFFSNNPTRDGAAYVDRLRGFGIDVEPGEACSAADVTVSYLRARHDTESVFLIGADEIGEILRENGVTVTQDPTEAQILLAGWTPDFHYEDMMDALRVYDEDVSFLGTDPDRTFPGEDGRPTPGSGAIVAAVAGVIETEPDHVLGKPSDEATRYALDRLDRPAEECLVVGDRLSTDIAMGERAGMETVLVLSGAADRDALEASQVSPDHVIDSLAEIGAVLEDWPSRRGH